MFKILFTHRHFWVVRLYNVWHIYNTIILVLVIGRHGDRFVGNGVVGILIGFQRCGIVDAHLHHPNKAKLVRRVLQHWGVPDWRALPLCCCAAVGCAREFGTGWQQAALAWVVQHWARQTLRVQSRSWSPCRWRCRTIAYGAARKGRNKQNCVANVTLLLLSCFDTSGVVLVVVGGVVSTLLALVANRSMSLTLP